MKNVLLSFFVMIATVAFAQSPSMPVPAPHQLKWHEAEMGVVFHYDLHVFDGLVYGQGNNRINPVEDYNIFNPTQLDTDQWIQAAKAAGAKFAVLTATHETGFGLWQSDVNPYCLKAVKWRDGKGDIQCEEKLSIEKSHIEGNLAAAQAQINNRINGDITVQGTLSLLREANIQGNITAAGLGVEEGAMMSGQITITRDCKEPFPASRDRHRPVAPSAPVESPVVVVQPASRIRSSGKPCPDVDGQLSLQARTESAGAEK